MPHGERLRTEDRHEPRYYRRRDGNTPGVAMARRIIEARRYKLARGNRTWAASFVGIHPA
jgi:hypothetical protein